MTKGCYTCRRRRIICDNGQPTCRKCRDAGKECLGYLKPLVWVKGGVASRGKMMGRSFEDTTHAAPEKAAHQKPAERTGTAAVKGRFGVASVAEASADEESHNSGVHKISRTDAGAHEFENFAVGATTEAVSTPEELETSLIHVPRSTSRAENIPAPWGLVDPLFKDFSHYSRFYLFHYNQHLVGDFALYSQVKNPYRDIISLVGSSPVLAYGLSAMGALHYSLLSDWDSSMMPWSPNSSGTVHSLMSPEEIEDVITPVVSRRPTSKAFEHFLEFKQRALNQLAADLSSPKMQKDDRTLAGIVVLGLLDLIESGSGAWSYHVEGAKNLLKSRPKNGSGQGLIEGLDTFAIDGCLIMEIMGSTLARPGALSRPFYSSMGPAILKRLEETCWVGCPAYLLEVIFFVHSLWYPDSETAAVTPDPSALPVPPGQPLSLESLAALLQGIRNFDPAAWAEEMQAFFFIPDVSVRVALGAAYQAAVYLYTSRVLSRARPGFSPPWTDLGLPADHGAVASELINQIGVIPPSDPHFKCLIWPTFIAGVECRRLSQRPLILDKLAALYQVITSVNVRNEAWVLRLMWQKQDLRRRQRHNNSDDEQQLLANDHLPPAQNILEDDDHDDVCDPTFDWLDELDHSRLDWLFI